MSLRGPLKHRAFIRERGVKLADLGTLMQVFDAVDDVGKRVRLTVSVKAEGAMTRDTLSRPRPPNPCVALSRGRARTGCRPRSRTLEGS